MKIPYKCVLNYIILIVGLHPYLHSEPPLLKQDSQTTYPYIKPKVEQWSPKEKDSLLLDIKPTIEWSPKEKLEKVMIEPKAEKVKVEMFSGLEKGDLVEQLAAKSKNIQDMISQIVEKDELLVKYQQMCEELQKGKHRSNSITDRYSITN